MFRQFCRPDDECGARDRHRARAARRAAGAGSGRRARPDAARRAVQQRATRGTAHADRALPRYPPHPAPDGDDQSARDRGGEPLAGTGQRSRPQGQGAGGCAAEANPGIRRSNRCSRSRQCSRCSIRSSNGPSSSATRCRTSKRRCSMRSSACGRGRKPPARCSRRRSRSCAPRPAPPPPPGATNARRAEHRHRTGRSELRLRPELRSLAGLRRVAYADVPPVYYAPLPGYGYPGALVAGLVSGAGVAVARGAVGLGPAELGLLLGRPLWGRERQRQSMEHDQPEPPVARRRGRGLARQQSRSAARWRHGSPVARSAGRCGQVVRPGWCGRAFRRAAMVRARVRASPGTPGVLPGGPGHRPGFPEVRGSDPDCLLVREVGPACRDTDRPAGLPGQGGRGTGPHRGPALGRSIRSRQAGDRTAAAAPECNRRGSPGRHRSRDPLLHRGPRSRGRRRGRASGHPGGRGGGGHGGGRRR